MIRLADTVWLLENLGNEKGKRRDRNLRYLYSQQSLHRPLNHAVCSDTVQPTSDRQGNMLCVWDVKPLASRPRSQHDHNTRSRERLCRFGRCCLIMVELTGFATARVEGKRETYEACKVEENVRRK
jgi:hypothetical protein